MATATRHFSALALLGLFLLGCSSLHDLQGLQAGLQSRFHMSAPGVELRNDTVLVIGIEDAAFVTMDSLARARTLDSMAHFVKDSYAGFGHLKAITIGLWRVEATANGTTRMPYYVKSYHAPTLVVISPIFQ